MAESKTKSTPKSDGRTWESSSALKMWRPFESLRREVERIFDDLIAR